MEFSDIIRDRYSCKKYDGRQLSQEQLSAILEAGRLAPTAKNLQEQHVYVIQSEEGLAKVDEVTPCRFGAPTVLLVAFNKDDVFTYPGGKRTSGVEDATIVATHMLLAAANEGVDSCWIMLDPFHHGFLWVYPLGWHPTGAQGAAAMALSRSAGWVSRIAGGLRGRRRSPARSSRSAGGYPMGRSTVSEKRPSAGSRVRLPAWRRAMSRMLRRPKPW